ncbi:MAG: ThuA domain-containing protein [Gammaproteobacteria bacterium]|nr:ThuA domain-containing protein [Gammaproteobacteria bacterium]
MTTTRLLAALALLASTALSAQSLAPPPAPYVPALTFQPVPVPVAPDTGRLQVLILSGRNSFEHDWRGTNNIMRRMLEDTRRFEVRVIEDFRGASARTLAPYDVVIVNYLGRWNYGDALEQRWGAAEEQALFDFVRSGRGIVLYHASLIMGAPSWPEFERLAGGTMRMTPPQSRRNPADAFLVHIVDRDHPITRGMRDYVWTLMDDMYTNMHWDPATPVRVLATARDSAAAYDTHVAGPKYPASAYGPDKLRALPGIDQEHPQVWTAEYGKGRVLGFAIGHGPDTLQYDGVQSLLIRGTEWAASGQVTLPLKDKAKAYLEDDK